MSTPSSNKGTPHDISAMVNASHKDVEEMEGVLNKLRNLSAEDKTELGHLRSRLDEQSQLIMILKRRADDVQERNHTLEKIIDELTEFRDNAKEELEREMKKHTMLEARFNELAYNHEEMIRFKDEHKQQNKRLRRENAELKAENAAKFNSSILERDEKIARLSGSLAELEERCLEERAGNQALAAELREKSDALQKELEALRKSSSDDVTSMTSQLKDAKAREEDLRSQLKSGEELRASVKAEMESSKSQLQKERDEMMELAMHRGKLLQEKAGEVKKLQDKVKETEKKMKDVQLKFEQEADAVSANAQVRKLRDQVLRHQTKYDDLTKQFEAYKKHSMGLLDKERDLNARLRHLQA